MSSKDPEKLPEPATAVSPRHARLKQALLVAAALVLATIHGARFCFNSATTAAQPGGGIWWSQCPDDSTTYCGFLNVPLDYTDPKADEVVSLSLRMIPATVPPKEQLGYLFTNPGGPGGSGTLAILAFGGFLSRIVSGRYNIISWDPRSVNLTSPGLECFANEGEASRFQRDVEHAGLSYEALGSSAIASAQNASLAAGVSWTGRIDAFSRALDSACDTPANQAILRASSTAFTARDMKRIMEALGEETLSYWGFSYGTILGATFSAMFPELVGRVVLDGVSDSQTYTNDLLEWGRSGMHDTRKVIEGFFSSCAESGPLGCAFAHDDSTGESLERRYDTLLGRLRDEPMPIGASAVGPGVLSASDVQYTMFHSLYAPKTWPHLAQLLADTERGNGSTMFAAANSGALSLSDKPSSIKHWPFRRPSGGFSSSTAAIMCSDTDPDAPGLRNSSVRSVWEYMGDLARTTRSPTADIWTIWIMQCRHWSAKAREVYRGPWTVADGLRKTNYPIVFFSLDADPVTPLSAAVKMQHGFGNSSSTLVTQSGFGHCSLAHPSLCTAKTIRSYFLNGTVPTLGTHCDADDGFLFPHPSNGSATAALEALSSEDAELRSAMWELSESAHAVGMGPHR
ncbi:hypothetical protein JCM9279_005534 [Rhodotorula babjevae]